MGRQNLEGPATQANLVAKVNALLNALRGGFFPRSVSGQPVSSDGSLAPDIGSATDNFDTLYCRNMVIGGVALDLSALSSGTTIGVISESNPTYAWPFNATKAMFIIISGASGAGGGGSGMNISFDLSNNPRRLRFRNFAYNVDQSLFARTAGSAGAAGNPTILTHTRTGKEYKTLAPAGGLGGDSIAGDAFTTKEVLASNQAADETTLEAFLSDDEYAFTNRDMITLKRDTHDASNNEGGKGGIRANSYENAYPPAYSFVDADYPLPSYSRFTSLIGGRGWPGGVSITRTIIDDIRDGDQFNIQLGAGGLGGAGAPLNTGGRAGNYAPRAAEAGKTGDPGIVLVIPLNETTA